MSLLLKKRQQVEANINVTSLVDVTMTVLIIFILIAPIIEQGVRVAAPSDATSEAKVLDEPKKNVSIVMERIVNGNKEQGIILVDSIRLSSTDNLKPTLEKIKEQNPEMIATIKVDPDFRYEYFITLMEIVNNLKIPIAIDE